MYLKKRFINLMKPKLLLVVNTYTTGAIPKILNLVLPTFLDIYDIKIISLEKLLDSSSLHKLNKNIEFKSLEMHRLNIIGSILLLRKEIADYSPNIIHSHLGRADLYSAICKTKYSKLISTVHTMCAFHYNRGLFNITQVLFRLLEYRFDYRVFISKTVSASWNFDKENSKNSIVYNPIENKKISNFKSVKKPFRILFVGRLLDFKNAILIVKSVKEILKTNSDIQLKIAGNGPEFDTIYKYIKKHKLDSHISMLGFCKELDFVYKESDVIVFPSLWSSGLPLVALEASQYNLALVASDITGIKEFITDNQNGLLFKSNSYFDLAKKILFLKNNPDKIDLLAENLKVLVSEVFSISKYSEKYLKIYEALLRKI